MIEKLIELRKRIALLQAEELERMAEIIAAAGHNKLGQATYEMDGHKITIKTGENVTLDNKRLDLVWNEKFPINRAYAYSLRQADYNAVMESGTPAQRKMLSEIVTTKPAKPSVKIIED